MAYESGNRSISAICNGTIVDPSNDLHGNFNIYIEDGLISEISGREPSSSDIVFDANGLYVAPGFIDLHTHLREPGFEYKEDIESGSRAALAGGFTTILCMPNTKPVNDCAEVTRRIVERADGVGIVKVLPVGAMTVDLKGGKLADYDGMLKEGIVAISDDGSCIQDERLALEAFEVAKEKGILIISHPEIFSKSKGGVMNEGEVSRRLGLPGIPRSAENDAIERDIDLARKTGARLHIAHVSTREGVGLVRRAKAEGLSITCEVAPHHLLLIDEDVERLGPNAKTNPPLRTADDRDALIEGLKHGTVDAIATDHAPHAADEKKDLQSAAFGVIGMETAFPVCAGLVRGKVISIERLIGLFTSGPAGVAGLSSGNLSLGSVADITIFNDSIQYSIDPSKFHSKSRNTPYAGFRANAQIIKSIRQHHF